MSGLVNNKSVVLKIDQNRRSPIKIQSTQKIAGKCNFKNYFSAILKISTKLTNK